MICYGVYQVILDLAELRRGHREGSGTVVNTMGLILEVDDSDNSRGSTGGSTVAMCWVLKPHSKYVVSCAWSPDGSLLATASHDKSVMLYAVSR
jgi:WD40 repeat protein